MFMLLAVKDAHLRLYLFFFKSSTKAWRLIMIQGVTSEMYISHTKYHETKYGSMVLGEKTIPLIYSC